MHGKACTSLRGYKPIGYANYLEKICGYLTGLDRRRAMKLDSDSAALIAEKLMMMNIG